MAIDEILTLDEVAVLLRVHRNTVAGLLKNGKLKGRKVGREWRISLKAIEGYFEGWD